MYKILIIIIIFGSLQWFCLGGGKEQAVNPRSPTQRKGKGIQQYLPVLCYTLFGPSEHDSIYMQRCILNATNCKLSICYNLHKSSVRGLFSQTDRQTDRE